MNDKSIKIFLIFLSFWFFQSCQPAKHLPEEIEIWINQLKSEKTLLAQSLLKHRNALRNLNDTKYNQFATLVRLSDSAIEASFQLIRLLEKGVENLGTDSSTHAWTTPQITDWCQQADAQIMQLRPLFYQFVDSAYQHTPVGFPKKIWVDNTLNVWNAQKFKTYNAANKLLYINLLETSIYALLCQLTQACKPQEPHFWVEAQTLPYLELTNATICKSHPYPLRVQISEQIALPNPKIRLHAYNPNNPKKDIPIAYSQNKAVITNIPKTKGKHEIYFGIGITNESTGESMGLSQGWVYVVK